MKHAPALLLVLTWTSTILAQYRPGGSGGTVIAYTTNETAKYLSAAPAVVGTNLSVRAKDNDFVVLADDGHVQLRVPAAGGGLVASNGLTASTVAATSFVGNADGLTNMQATAESVTIPPSNALHGVSRTLNADVFARRLYANLNPSSAAYATTNFNMVVMGDSVTESWVLHLANYLASGLGLNGGLNMGQTNGTRYFDGLGSLGYGIKDGSGTITLVTNYDAWPIPYYRMDAGAYRTIAASNYQASAVTNGFGVSRISASWITHPSDGTLTVWASTNGGAFGSIASWSLDGTDGAFFATNFSVALGTQPVRIRYGVVGGAGGDVVTFGAYKYNFSGLNYSTFGKSGLSISNLFNLSAITNFVRFLNTNSVQMVSWHGKENLVDLTNAMAGMDYIVTNATNVVFWVQGTPPDRYADQPVQNDWLRDWCKLRRQFYFDGNTMFGNTNQMIELGWLGVDYGSGPDYIHARTTTGAGALWLSHFLRAVPLDALCTPLFNGALTAVDKYGIANEMTAEIPVTSRFALPGATKTVWPHMNFMRGIRVGHLSDTNGNDGYVQVCAKDSSFYYTRWDMLGRTNVWRNYWGDELRFDLSQTNFQIYATNKLAIGTTGNPVHVNASSVAVSDTVTTSNLSIIQSVIDSSITNVGLMLSNTQPATADAPGRWSPPIWWSGTAWSSNAGASVAQDWFMGPTNIPGLASPTGQFEIWYRLSNGAPTKVFSVTSGGLITSPGSVSVSGAMYASQGLYPGGFVGSSIRSPANGTITLGSSTATENNTNICLGLSTNSPTLTAITHSNNNQHLGLNGRLTVTNGLGSICSSNEPIAASGWTNTWLVNAQLVFTGGTSYVTNAAGTLVATFTTPTNAFWILQPGGKLIGTGLSGSAAAF